MTSNPLIVPNALYTTEQLISSLDISSATLHAWIGQGLRSAKRGTKRRYFLGQDVISFMLDLPSDSGERIRIRRDEVYRSDEVMAALGIGRDTLQKWLNDGLPYAQPSTRSMFFLGSDILDFLAARVKSRKEVVKS